jgi:antitoxin component YwqK of YwqJK toxin-antitoxin module
MEVYTLSGRLLKCYGYCGKSYPKEELIKVGSQNHCHSCADRKHKEQKDRETLYKTIQMIYKIPYPNGQMLRQIKQFSEDRNYTLEGMTKALCYFVKVMKKTPFLNGGLSFLPYHYDSAQKYYEELEERRKNAKDVNTNTKTLVIGPIKHNNEVYKKRKIVSMEALLHDN